MIEKRRRVIFDTNVFVSAVLRPASVPAQALSSALRLDSILTSSNLVDELSEVLLRPKFLPFRSMEERRERLVELSLAFERVDISCHVSDCRHPSDNKFLEAALSGDADIIVTGDNDLLSLHPWRGISILTPADFLALAG